MNVAVETIDPVTRKLTVEVEPARVKKAMDRAARELAQQVDIPGFRKGKAPRRMIEQRFGKAAVANQAMDDALNSYYNEALNAESIRPVSQPEVDVQTFDETDGCTFEVTVEVTPSFEAPDHAGIEVTWPDWDVMDADVETQIEELRQRFAEVDEVERPAKDGDYVTIDLVTIIDGEAIDDASVEDALYEVGSGGVTPKLDTELVGKEADDEFQYTDTMPDEFPEHGGSEGTFTVTVKDVREKTLPDIDDDFAETASEFDTVQELRADIRRNLLRKSVNQAQHDVREHVLEAYVAKVDIPLPPSLVDDELAQRRHQIEHQAEQYGMSFEDMIAAEDLDEEAWELTARGNAETSIKARLVLEQLAEQLGVEVTPDMVNMEIMRHAMQNQVSPDQIAKIIDEQGTLPSLVGDIVRRQAIDAVYDASTLTGGPSDEVLIELGMKPDPEAEAKAAETAAAQDEDGDAEDDSDSSDSSDDSDSSDSSDTSVVE